MDKIELAYIELKAQALLDVMCEERQDFYRKHTALFQKLRLRLPVEVRNELDEIESLFNEGLVNGKEMYQMGFKEGMLFKIKSP